MNAASFLPALAPSDVERAAQLIQQANSPILPPEDQRRCQQELFEIQRRPEAWGLIVPFLNHHDSYVQFFGAHTAQVKVARDWDSLPHDHALQLRDLILQLSGFLISTGKDKFIMRKLFVAVIALALRLASLPPSDPIHWSDWILTSVTALSGHGSSTASILEFLEIAAEEVQRADLLGPSKSRMQQTLSDAVPIVVQAVNSSISGYLIHRTDLQPPSQSLIELASALKCLEAWMNIFPTSELTPLIPSLINLLGPFTSASGGDPIFNEDTFVSTCDTLQEILSSSPLSDGSGSKTLTEPLLCWIDAWGGGIVQITLEDGGSVDAVSSALCKLLVALGDHSTQYIASNLASEVALAPTTSNGQTTAFPSFAIQPPKTRGALVQTFLRLLLSYTSLPGYYGVDEEESEKTLGFWYLFQEALWSKGEEDYDESATGTLDETAVSTKKEEEQWEVAKAVYVEVVKALRRKIVWPEDHALRGWTKDLKDKFKVYRRDVGDALINAYYLLRNDMLGFYVTDIVDRLTDPQEGQWEDIEGTLHCIMSIQEAVPLDENVHLSRVFGADILLRLPTTGDHRVRNTAIGLVGEYASWFTTQSSPTPGSAATSLLMNAVSYVVAALPEPALCLTAANALRDLCDSNRTALAPHIGAFAELYAGLNGIPDTERSKVLQSIASVIQALPPEEEIPPVEAMVTPVVGRLLEAVNSAPQHPEEARALAIQQLQTLSGVAKGLTRATDSVFLLEDSPVTEEAQRMERARADPRMLSLRQNILNAIRSAVNVWCTDAGVSDALSDLIKAITSLPSDTTLVSLLPGPLLELVCVASERQLTAVWLSLASMLVVQLDPPSFIPPTLKSTPNSEALETLAQILPALLQNSLTPLSEPGAMEANPDIVQAFFGCMETFAQHHIEAFNRLPPGGLDSLLHCAEVSLTLQERYSLVSACTFLGSLTTKTCTNDALGPMKDAIAQAHGRTIMRAVLCGFAGAVPRSATLNLVELLMVLMTRYPAESRAWVSEVLSSDDFMQSKAGPEAKETFAKALSGPRSMKRVRDAAQQFALVARGLEGSSFGFATV